jgi:hypothetical protein
MQSHKLNSCAHKNCDIFVLLPLDCAMTISSANNIEQSSSDAQKKIGN